MADFRQQAEHFLTCETQFHLGGLPTEQSHPATRGLAETLQRDVAAGIRLLQAVDRDVVAMADRVFASDQYARLVEALVTALSTGRRVCFSGCGATGRLSIMLEAMWRQFCAANGHAAWADQVVSIMTGGDYALIRSVEGFEDYLTFGRQQVREAGLSAADVLVAISEGGETSSVIGTIHEALDRGARAFFVFNNPATVLAAHIERSRAVIEHPAVTVLDLSSGPMAVTGSTRMQATTSELLVVGSALEQALAQLLPELPAPPAPPAQLAALLDDLARPAAVGVLAEWVGLERDLYAAQGRVTYYAGECLLDIFTDTTERAPTFMLPPFRKCDDTVSPASWAFVKNPLLPTPAAWQAVLGRAPRCLDWSSDRYRALGGPASAVSCPPQLNAPELVKFLIGCELDTSRWATSASAAIAVLLSTEQSGADAARWAVAFTDAAAPFAQCRAMVIGDTAADLPGRGLTRQVPCHLAASPLKLWHRLAAKLVLNTVSTATMGCLGRLVSNWMAHVECSNKKLIDRGTRLVSELAEVDYRTACIALHETIAQQQSASAPGGERVSPVAETIRRLLSQRS